MKKIAVICTLYGPNGGTGRVTTELFERFARDGYQVDVFCGAYDKEFVKTSKVHRVTELGITKIGILSQLHMLYKATRMVNKAAYDIVYTTGDYYLFPDFVTVHMLKKNARVTVEELEKEGILESRDSWGKKILRKIYMPLLFEVGENIVYRNSNTHYLCVSEGVRADFLERFPQTTNENVKAIPNGVDFERFKRNQSVREEIRTRLGFKRDEKVLLFVGSDWRRKRLQIAIQLLGQFPELKLVVLGHDSPEEYKPMLVENECIDRVYFEGFVRNVHEYYSACDYFVFPSVYETFGLVALEAMAAGMVVISNDLNGVREFIKNGENGYITKDAGIKAFAECLEQVLSCPERESIVRKNAVRTAKEMDWENIYQNYKCKFDRYSRGGK